MKALRRLLSTLTLLLAASRTLAGLPLPDTPTVTDLEEFQRACLSLSATASLMNTTGQKEKAAELYASLWERYDAELAARRCQLADLSLAAINPFLPAEERQAAANALAPAVAQLATLSTFHTPDPARRASDLTAAGREPTEARRLGSEAHAALKEIRYQLSNATRGHEEVADFASDYSAQLYRAAVARDPLGPYVAQIRELPASGDAFHSLAQQLAAPEMIEGLYHRTGESLALEATLAKLTALDPANATFWVARARARFAFGWRAGAATCAIIASQFDPNAPGLAAVSQALKDTPPAYAAICQEWIDPDTANEAIRLRSDAQAAGKPAAALTPAMERAARAALRNRARRLYAATFMNKPEQRQAALKLIDQHHSVPPGLAPVYDPELGKQYEAELTAAGNNAAARFATQQRYAALFGVTEIFWYNQVVLLLGTGQRAAVLAATDVAGAMFPAAAWVKEARAKAEAAPTPPANP